MDKNSDEILSAENLKENEYVVTASVIDPPAEKKVAQPLKISFFTVVLSALSLRRNMGMDARLRSVRPSKTIKALLLVIVLSIAFLLLYDFIDGKMIIPVLLCFCSAAVPALVISLHYELCPQKTVSGLQMLSVFFAGLFAYMIIYALTSGLLVRYIYQSTIDAVIIPLLWGITELLILFTVTRIFNITDLSSCMLLAVCIGMGFCFARGIYKNFSELFYQIEIQAQAGGSSYFGSAILDDAEIMRISVLEMLKSVPLTGVYYPFMFSCWSVIIGNVVSSDGVLKDRKKERPISIYLLLVMVIVLYMLCEFQTTFNGFDIILKGVCALVSVVLAVRKLNLALSRSLSDDDGSLPSK